MDFFLFKRSFLPKDGELVPETTPCFLAMNSFLDFYLKGAGEGGEGAEKVIY
jgi:hypothetical protein